MAQIFIPISKVGNFLALTFPIYYIKLKTERGQTTVQIN